MSLTMIIGSMTGKSEYFKLYELLPPEIYYNENIGWEWIDARLLRCLDAVRELINRPIYVNTWKFGGNYRYRCVRIAACPVYRPTSYHSLSDTRKVMAADFSANAITAEQIRQAIVSEGDKFPYPIRLESDVTWVHLDVANTSSKYISFFKA